MGMERETMSSRPSRFKKFAAVGLLTAILAAPITASKVYAQSNADDLKSQVVGDLVSAGVSVAIAASGSVPLALMGGYLTKYISTYGVEGVKALVNFFKGHEPQDLGEINIYYIYLLNIKRNLYQTLIMIRQSVQNVDANQNLVKQLDDLEATLKNECDVAKGCKADALNDTLVNMQFLNLALDAKASLDVNRYLEVREIKDTYQYMILLYLDVVIVEQKLLEAQSNAMASRTIQTMKELKKNRYISQEEKEFQGQILLNMALRWKLLADTRRVLVAQAVQKPIADLESENEAIKKKLGPYRGKDRK